MTEKLGKWFGKYIEDLSREELLKVIKHQAEEMKKAGLYVSRYCAFCPNKGKYTICIRCSAKQTADELVEISDEIADVLEKKARQFRDRARKNRSKLE